MSVEWKDGHYGSTLELAYGGKVILLLTAWPDRWRDKDGEWLWQVGGRKEGRAATVPAAKLAAENAAAEILTEGLRALGRTCGECAEFWQDDEGRNYCGDFQMLGGADHGCYDWSPREVK